MAETIVLDKDTGVKTAYAEEDGKTIIQTCQDVSAYLKEAEAARFHHRGFSQNDGLYHSARIPFEALNMWKHQYGFDWFNCTDDEKKRWLNGPQCAPYRTTRGKV